MATSSAAVGGAPMPFAHLHLHTEYSLLDGGNRIDRLVDRVAELGMRAVAITDHGNLFGAVAFYTACRERGIKPILGVEAYVTPPGRPRSDRTYTGGGEGGYHLVLLALNNAGWRNLLVLCSEAYLTGFYYKPRIDRELLEKHADGLIAINGHLGSEIGDHLLAFERTGDEKHWSAAEESARWHARVFARADAPVDRFYIELQHHVPEQNSINPHLIRLARGLDLPLVCDNDAHFLRAEDHDAHDSLICISTGVTKETRERLHYTPELYVKSPAQMRGLFEPYGDAGRESLENAARIADACDVTLPVGGDHAPLVRVVIPPPSALPRHDDPAFGGDLGAWYRAFSAAFELQPFPTAPSDDERAAAKRDCDRALRLLAEAGLVWRYGSADHPLVSGPAREEIVARLERELVILADKAISAYFLIVWDFVNWGRQRAIPALARGSGVGTMVGYVLGLSNACPVRYGLLFERFTDPDRSEFPDIDIDLCQDGRASVIDYVRRKYGHVAQIITFGTLKARAAVRDVGRVLGMSIPDVDRVAKMIPEALGMTLGAALEESPDLRRLCAEREDVRRLIDTARSIEGQVRHAGVHAAGVIVATRPLIEIVPLYRQSGAPETDIVTQWDGPTCEKLGLLKMDFLGLRTISVIERCRALIRDSLPEREVWNAVGRGGEFGGEGAGAHPLDLDRLTFDDQRVFDMFRRGDTTGVFQFESPGMRRLLVEMKPDRLEDLIAANALFRPGPMDLIPDYNRRKHGQDRVPQVHPIVDRFTSETYGVMVYQEQVMQIVHGLGGIPLRAAYSLIKAISKKKEKVIDAERPGFIAGAMRHGLTKVKAEELFELILKFAGYGFNKSHSTGYAIVAYQTAYLKTFFPNHYMAAFLTYESGANKVADWIPYLEDCRTTRFIDPATGASVRTGVEVRPPDINLSVADFAVVYEEGEPRTARHGHVRFGLGAVKGAGDKAIDAIVAERADGPDARPFSTIFDFCERVLARAGGGVNRATVEALITCGAFDSVHSRGARSAMLATLERAFGAAQSAASDRASGQGSLFGPGAAPGDRPPAIAQTQLEKAPAWSEAETLQREKDVLGFYVSSHPLDRWKHWTGVFANTGAGECRDGAQDQRVVLAGLVQKVRTMVVKSGRAAGQKMGVVTLEDRTGVVDGVMFTDQFARYGHLAEPDRPVFMLGRIDLSRGEPQIIVDKLVPMEGVPLMPGRLQVTIDVDSLNGEAGGALDTVAQILKPVMNGAADSFPLELVVAAGADAAVLAPGASSRVPLEPELVKRLDDLLGRGSVRVVGGLSVEANARDQRPPSRRPATAQR